MISYTTQPGDTLSAIAGKYGVPISSVTGYKSGDPNNIGVGENLSIATPKQPTAADVSAAQTITKPQQQQDANLTAAIQQLQSYEPPTAPTSQDVSADPTVQAQQQQVNEINKQIALHKAATLQQQEQALQRGDTLGFAAGEAARVNRNNAIEGMRLAALAEAAQGNLSLAETHAQRALTLKYDAQQQNIKDARSTIIANWDKLTPSEQKAAEQRLLELNSNDSFIAQQKAQDQQTMQIVTSAVSAARSAGQVIPTSVLTKAMNSTPQEATAMLARYGTKTIVSGGGSGSGGAASGKAPTVTQMQYGNYAPRLLMADKTIKDLTSSVSGMSPFTFGIYDNLPSFLQPSDIQQYNQAKLNFINAVLRQESGAAISASEYDKYAKQYFPVPGDSQATIDQKRQNREQVIQSYIKNAGPAYSSPVADTGTGANDQYAQYRSQLQGNEILVQRGNQILAVTPDELQPNDQQL